MRKKSGKPVAACVALALLCSCAIFTSNKKHAAVKGSVFFTKVNMWHVKEEILSTNYHLGELLPAGTRVTVTRCRGGKIEFESEAGNKYTLVHATRHSRIELGKLFDRHFGRSDVTSSIGIYADFSPREQANVDEGTIAIGMSKNAVLMAYGYPPSHRTPDLQADTWTYWTGRRVATVRFRNDTVSSIEGVQAMRAVKFYVVSDPPGALIEADGRFVGKAPCIVDLEIEPRDMATRKLFRASPAKPDAPRLGVLCDAPMSSETLAGDPITVREVIPLSSGHKLGLVPGDKILAVNGVQIRNEFECMNAIRRTGFGKPLRMSIRRGGREMSLLGRTDVQESGTFYPRQKEYAVSTLVDMDGKVMFFDLRRKSGSATTPVAVGPPPVDATHTPPVVTPPPVRGLPDLPMIGNGFLVTKEGHIITCASALSGVKQIVVRTSAGRKHAASIVHSDQVNDWCLLKAATLRGTPLPVGGQTSIKTGSRVFRLGYPAGGKGGVAVSRGRIASPQGFGGDPRHLQVKMDGVAKNVSGAPVVSAYGEWLGVASDRLDKIIHAFAGVAAADVNFLLKAKTISGLLPSDVVLPMGAGPRGTELDEAGAKKKLSAAILSVHAK